MFSTLSSLFSVVFLSSIGSAFGGKEGTLSSLKTEKGATSTVPQHVFNKNYQSKNENEEKRGEDLHGGVSNLDFRDMLVDVP